MSKHDTIFPMTEVTFAANNITKYDYALDFSWLFLGSGESKIFINLRTHRKLIGGLIGDYRFYGDVLDEEKIFKMYTLILDVEGIFFQRKVRTFLGEVSRMGGLLVSFTSFLAVMYYILCKPVIVLERSVAY